MVDRYLSPKFGLNSFSGIRENDMYGRRTVDGRSREDSSSAVQKHKAGLKSEKNMYVPRQPTAKNMNEIRAIGSEIIATQTGVRTDEGQSPIP